MQARSSGLRPGSIHGCDKRFMDELRTGEKGVPQRFWRRLRSETRTTVWTQVLIPRETNVEIMRAQCVTFIEQWPGNLFGCDTPRTDEGEAATEEGDEENPNRENNRERITADLQGRPTDGELTRAVHIAGVKTAVANDEILMSRGLGTMMRAVVAKSLTEIFSNAEIPDAWKETRVEPQYKRKGERAELGNYRPITPSGVQTVYPGHQSKTTAMGAERRGARRATERLPRGKMQRRLPLRGHIMHRGCSPERQAFLCGISRYLIGV